MYCNAHAQQNDLSAVVEENKMVHDLLDFKLTGGSSMIILTSETWLVTKDYYEGELTWIPNFEWRKFASTRIVMQPIWTNGPKTWWHYLVNFSEDLCFLTWLFIGTCRQFMLPQIETLKTSRKVVKFLLEVQHCKSSYMEFEIWESRCQC